jgi:hypothetical protein
MYESFLIQSRRINLPNRQTDLFGSTVVPCHLGTYIEYNQREHAENVFFQGKAHCTLDRPVVDNVLVYKQGCPLDSFRCSPGFWLIAPGTRHLGKIQHNLGSWLSLSHVFCSGLSD